MSGFAKSVGDMVGRVFQSVSPEAWFPAAVLVSVTAYFIAVDSTEKESARDGLTVLASVGWGGLAIGVLLTAGVAVLIQPFQFALIRGLEGYWFNPEKKSLLRKKLVARFENLQASVDADKQELVESGSASISVGDRAAIAEHRNQVEFETESTQGSCDERQLRIVLPVTGLAEARTQRLLDRLPRDQEFLPTRLGNVMRAAEVDFNRADHLRSRPIEERFLISLPGAPSELTGQYALHRARLDTYCTLTWIFALLVPIGYSWLWKDNWAMLLLFVPVIAAFISYGGALAAASGYATAVRALAAWVANFGKETKSVAETTGIPAQQDLVPTS